MTHASGGNPEAPRCRRASAADHSAIAALRRALGLPGDPHAWVTGRLRGDRDFPDRQALFVADIAGRVVGYALAQSFAWDHDAPPDGAPSGFYLAGVFVEPGSRRLGAGLALVQTRLRWISARSRVAYFYADDHNAASIAMHRKAGFRPLMTDFVHPWVRDPTSKMTLYVLEDHSPHRTR